MLQDEVIKLFKDIFDLKKVTFDEAGETFEQDTLFVTVESYRESVKDGEVKGILRGTAKIYSQSKKIPYGFFNRKLTEASLDLTKNLFFTDFESNTNVYQNLVERSFSFTYFYTTQYDPEKGELTTIEF